MKKTIALIFSFILVLASLCSALSASALSPTVPDTSNAYAVCLYNVNTEQSIYGKNLHEKIFPGGAVKMMTGLIACEMLSDRLDDRITVTPQMLEGVSGNNIKLKEGMSVTVENLMYGVLCAGGNDAACVLSIACKGSIDAFVRLMNTKAKEWGLENTHFTNPTGLDDPDMFSTLSDIMVIAKKAYENELYLDISSAMSYVFTPAGESEEIKIFNRNALISTFYASGYRNPNCMGLISSNTELGGNCVITYAQKKDTGYICAVMRASEDDDKVYSYEIANSLLKYAFDNFYYLRIAESDQYVCDIPVSFAMPNEDGEEYRLKCVIQNDVYALTNSSIDVQNDLKYRYYFHNEDINAPITAGDIVGGVDIIYDGEVLGTARLVAAEDVTENGMLVILEKMKLFFLGREFWLFVVFFVIIVALYCFHIRRKLQRKRVKHIGHNNH